MVEKKRLIFLAEIIQQMKSDKAADILSNINRTLAAAILCNMKTWISESSHGKSLPGKILECMELEISLEILEEMGKPTPEESLLELESELVKIEKKGD